jgi:hypothetical protein
MRGPVLLSSWVGAVALLSVMGCRDDIQSPTEPAAQPALATSSTALAFSQLSGSGFNTCGVTTEFRAFCWGFNDNGELGDGTTGSSTTPVARRSPVHPGDYRRPPQLRAHHRWPSLLLG